MSRILRPARAANAALRSYATVAADSTSVRGVKVAAVDAGQPTSSVTVVVKAGSRYETAPGVAHVLKNFAFKSTSAGSALKTIRETELYGGVLSSALSREHLYLTAEFLRGDEDYFLSLFAQVLSSTKFTAHEYTELVLPVVQAEWIGHVASPSTLAFDVAHTLAFRRGLGNSLYASPTSPVSIDQVKAYAKQAFAKDNISVLGTGISAGALEKAVGSAFGSSGAAGGGGGLQTSGAQYFGGEQRVPLDVHSAAGAQPTMIIAYGATGASHADLSVLSHLLGGTSSLKWAPGASPLSLAADKISGASAKAFVLPYSDAALFGVVVSAPTSENVKALATEVAGLVKALGSEAKDDALKRAVAKAKFEVASATETKEGLMASFAPQLGSGNIKPLDDTFSALSSVTAANAAKAAKEMFKSKPTVVAVGDLQILPYADELNL